MRLARRDLAALGVVAVGAFILAGAYPYAATWIFAALPVGAIVGYGWPRLFGAHWSEASLALGSSVATTVICIPLAKNADPGAYALSLVLPALGALPLADLIARRDPDPRTTRLLQAASVGCAAVVALFALTRGPFDPAWVLPYLLMAMVALLPALGVVIDPTTIDATPTASRLTDRLALVALGATPGAAMTLLPGSAPNPLLFIGWLLVLVIWRRFTITPLLRVSQRTQQERDLTVSAIEAERARIAADLHDDALQELTALVRRLDQAGDSEGAELARGVAERLRVICSDLRLPLLDDLGAGAALEWLVTRMEPMADGEVRLERIDASRPPSGVELAVFRIAQEALANAVRHGKPPITVRYRVDDSGHVSLSIDDQGAGIAPTAAEHALAAGHLGLANMQQRAEQIGGLLDVRRWPSGGTHVALEWRPR